MPVVVDPPAQEPSPPQISVEVFDGGGGGKTLLVDIHVTFDADEVKFKRTRSHGSRFKSGPGWHHWSLVPCTPERTKFWRRLRKATKGAKVRFRVIDWTNGATVRRTLTLKKDL